ncbi:MAG: hypothetical protein EXS44_02455 [Candidatus Levybacteria bacterium]|nr:hypothetical protein [Candidatus Levybacteria bacterium]
MNRYFLLVIFLSCIPLYNLLMPGLPITHDGQDHVARIANFYQNLQDGNLIPRWAPNLNWGYGHPVLMFLYPLPSYMASFFHFLGASFVDSIKLVFGITFILSGVSMYIFMKSIADDRSAFIASLLYMYAPYRFVDLYVRGAIGEHVSFIFPPLVLFFLYKLSREINWYYIIGGAFSLGGFIIAHNAISIMFLPIEFIYFIYLLWNLKNKRAFIISASLIFILGFGLTSFFWIPAFFEGKYTLRDIVTIDGYLDRFVNPKDFIYGKWDYGGTGLFTVQVGIIQWFFILSAIITFFLKNKKNKILILGLFIIFILSLFIQTSYSLTVWKLVTTLQKFQFPWRFLSINLFTTSMIAGLIMYAIPKKYSLNICIIIIILSLFLTKDYWHAKAYSQKPELFYTSIYNGTTDTGESAPIWSIRFMEKRPKSKTEVISGVANVQELYRTSTEHRYLIESKIDSQIRENTIYFPGWHIFVDGHEVSLEFQDINNRGVITFRLSKGKHIVNMIFQNTKVRLLSNYISLGCLVIIVVCSILISRIWRRFQLF